MKAILALDQGTTSSRAMLFDREGHVLGLGRRSFTQLYPQPGWVEHNPNEIWESQLVAMREALVASGLKAPEIAAIGIANQRETTIVWERESGQAVANAIVWQCRRTAQACEALRMAGKEEMIRAKTGLLIDPYFSASKLAWLLDRLPRGRARARAGELLFGTVDSWLLWKLSGGQCHATDISNASRTLLFNIHTQRWDEELLKLFDIPAAMLPRVLPSSGEFATTAPELLGGHALPICGMAGDQQAALFGQGCHERGMAKNTYGTGCFLLLNSGHEAVMSRNRLLTTIAWQIGGETTYALEGSVFSAGSAIQWLRDELGIISEASESERLARMVEDNGGVYLVPAFTGLGAPYWASEARAAIVGLTRGSGRAHLARAALEAIAYQSRELLLAMESDAAMQLRELRVDGGGAANDFLLQFQADMLGVPVLRPANLEATAFGVAALAGLATGFWRDQQQLREFTSSGSRFMPRMPATERERYFSGWQAAVRRTLPQAGSVD